MHAWVVSLDCRDPVQEVQNIEQYVDPRKGAETACLSPFSTWASRLLDYFSLQVWISINRVAGFRLVRSFLGSWHVEAVDD